MIELIFAAVGVGLVILATVHFLRSLGDRRTSFRAKFWEWTKNVWDVIT